MRQLTAREILWQLLRKLTQLSTLGFVAYVAVSVHWRNFKVAHNSARIVGLMTNDFNAWLYDLNERMLEWVSSDSLAVSDSLTGLPWSMRVGGVPFTDPWAVVAVGAGGVMPPLAMVLGAVFPLLLAVLLGKVYCSFLCPARLMFELANGVRRGAMRLGLPLPAWRLPRIGLYVGLGAVLAAMSAGPAVFQWVLPYYALGAGVATWFTSGAVAGTVVWAMALLLFDLLFAPGQICRSLCPTGALLEQFGRAPALALVRSQGDCPPRCDLCERACPYGLYPGKQTHRPTCDTCGRCTIACPRKKLSARLVRPFLSLLLVAMLLPIAPSAWAHHNKGLPHYGYFDNYPQVPTEEFIDEVGRWEVGAVFFNFQGMDRKSSDTPDDVRIFAYAYDLESGRGFKGELTLFLADEQGEILDSFERVAPDQEGVYVVRTTLPASGRYKLLFDLESGGAVDRVPLAFDIDLEADRVPWMLIGLGATLLAVVFAVAAAGRRDKAARRSAPATEVSDGP